MPKMKTRSSAKKRFKKISKRLIKRAKAFRRHLLTKKTAKRKDQLRGPAYVHSSDVGRIARMLPND
jgi:large subunit ribosomal protein L35